MNLGWNKSCWKRDVERRNLLLKGFMLFKVVFRLLLFNLCSLCSATGQGRNISFKEKQIISQINLNFHSRQCLDDLTSVLPQNAQRNKKKINVTLLKSAWYSFVNSKFPPSDKAVMENSICISCQPPETQQKVRLDKIMAPEPKWCSLSGKQIFSSPGRAGQSGVLTWE